MKEGRKKTERRTWHAKIRSEIEIRVVEIVRTG
jgi:hypothetical protein